MSPTSAERKRRKNPAAVRLAGRRAQKLSAARRKAIARQAARARWDQRKPVDRLSRRSSIEEIAEELTRDIPAEEWNRLPPDLIDHLDHYLYGWPKR